MYPDICYVVKAGKKYVLIVGIDHYQWKVIERLPVSLKPLKL